MQQWQLRPLAISLAIATVLFTSYLTPGPAELWYMLDVHVAFNLNSLVETSQLQQLIWSIGNMRLFDDVIAVAMLMLLLHYVVRGPQGTPSVRGAQAIVISVMLVVLVALTRDVIFPDVAHDSPSLVLEPFTRLSEVNSLGVKDSSAVSFPGDHATVVSTFVFLLWVLAGWRYGFVASIIAAIACMPRLVAGAHWLTDDVVGGMGTAFATVPWVVFTPLAGAIVSRLVPRLAWLGYRVRPLLMRLQQ